MKAALAGFAFVMLIPLPVYLRGNGWLIVFGSVWMFATIVLACRADDKTEAGG